MYRTLAPFAGFDDLARLLDEVGSWFDRGAIAGPASNVSHSDQGAIVQFALPGYHKDDLTIEADGDELVVSGSSPEPQADEQRRYLRRELPHGRFSRRVHLPFVVDIDRSEARFENGILTIAVAKPEAEQPRRITIA